MFGSQTRPGMRGTSSLGSLGDDTLGARTYKLEPLGAASGSDPDPFTTFGRRAARALLARAQGLPLSQRSAALKREMARLDPTLPARAEKLTAEARRRGLPAGQALEHGMAAAMSQGVIGELAKLGQTKMAPPPRSLLGLGLSRGRTPLGADPIMAIAFQPAPSSSSGVNVFTTGTTSTAAANVTCGGYSWTGTEWVRTKVGQVDVPGPKPCPATSTSSGGIVVTGAEEPWIGPMIQFGPFVFPYKSGAKMSFAPDRLSAEQAAVVTQAILKASTNVLLMQAMPGAMPESNVNYVGFEEASRLFLGGQGKIPKKVTAGGVPIFRVKDPTTGNYWGVKIVAIGTADRPSFGLELVTWESSWLGKIVDGVTEFIGAIIDVVGDMVCGLVNQPGASTAAASTGPYGAIVGVGMEVAKNTKCQLPPPPPLVEGMNWLLPVAIAGGALVLVLALRK